MAANVIKFWVGDISEDVGIPFITERVCGMIDGAKNVAFDDVLPGELID
jgi:hypothetical protein